MNLQSVRFIIFTNSISIDWKEDKTTNTFVSKYYTYNTTTYVLVQLHRYLFMLWEVEPFCARHNNTLWHNS